MSSLMAALTLTLSRQHFGELTDFVSTLLHYLLSIGECEPWEELTRVMVIPQSDLRVTSEEPVSMGTLGLG